MDETLPPDGSAPAAPAAQPAQPEHHWYSFLSALVNALRNHDDTARIPDEVQQTVPTPMQQIDRHNAALEDAFRQSNG